MNENQLLTASQLADYLQFRVETIYKWAREGRIPAIKAVGVWRFRLRDIEDWLARHTQDEEVRQENMLGEEETSREGA